MFESTFESLYSYNCPDWLKNAKFGICNNWGPQRVLVYGDWNTR